MRAITHYTLTALLLTFYGGQVCPFLEGLGTLQVGGVLAGAFVLVLALRLPLQKKVVLDLPPLAQPQRQLALDLGLFLGAGAALTVFNAAVFKFPLGSGLKVVLGCATLGLFAALDLALARERRVAAAVDGTLLTRLPPGHLFSLPKKFSFIAIGSVLLVAGTVALLVVKDFHWLAEHPSADPAVARNAVLFEVAFVGVVLVVLSLNLVFSYAANLRRHFAMQTEVLEAVRRGDLSRQVPVTSRDEFGQIADHTNTMIEGLKERERVKELFGKVVSPQVAERLMAEQGQLLGGQRQRLVILMSDVRGFTGRSESAAPEQLVADLNTYFGRMVEQVQKHGGIVDKFIGDGLLAFFGLDADEDAAGRALAAAKGMLHVLPELNTQLSAPVQIGIGLHHGEAVAGAIGSPDRLEFTIIGDAVNTASRLEALSKDVGCPLVLSEPLFNKLREPDRPGLTDLGAHQVKGRTQPIHVYGWGP